MFDVGYLAFYMVVSIYRGQIPFLSFFEEAFHSAVMIFAVPSAIFLTLLLISVAYSGWALIQGRLSGIYVAYAQIPFRFFAVIPSFFPVIWLPRIIPWHTRWQLGLIAVAAFLASESTKVILLERSRRKLFRGARIIE